MPNLKLVLACLAVAAGMLAAPGCVVMKKEKHQKMVNQLAETQVLLDKAGEELTVAKADLTETKGLLAKAKGDLTDARTQDNKERLKLKKDLDQAKSEKSKLTLELTRLRLAEKDNAKAAAADKRTIASLNADLDKKTAALAGLQKKNADQQKKLAQLAESVANLEGEIAKLKKAAATAPSP